MVLGASESLGQHLIAHPEHLDWLDGGWTATAEASGPSCCRSVGADPDAALPLATDPVGDGLRLAYRAHLLRIAARDLCVPEPIEVMPTVADELSDLADATLEAALAIGRAKVGPNALKTRLAVVGLGKCGAQELNYVSDVDVLYVAEPALDDDGEPLITNEQAITVATRMAAELTRICSAHTGGRHHLGGGRRAAAGGQGRPARPDAGQPPHLLRAAGRRPGSSRPCSSPDRVPATSSSARTSSTWWRRWSGRRPSGRTSSPTPRPCASGWSRTSRPATPGRSSSSARAGCATSSSPSSCCSWCTAGSTSGSGTGPPCDALKALIDNGYVGREDGKGFGLAYRFLRTLEHRIQLFRLRRTHVLPDTEEDLRRIGRSLGYADPAEQLARSGGPAPSGSAGCTSGCSTHRCSTRSPGSPPGSCG